MSLNYPLHQRRKWQPDENRRRDEQNSHSYWDAAPSDSQTTCKERDGPLSSANSYISSNGTSPWAVSRTSRHADILWLHTSRVLSRLFCASWLSAVYIVEEKKKTICIVLRWPTLRHIFYMNGLLAMQNAYFVYRLVVLPLLDMPSLCFRRCMRGNMARHLPRVSGQGALPGHSNAQ